MPDLKLDLDAMADAATGLRALRTEFLAAEEFNRGLADAAGHRRLGSAIDDFASAWNIRRERLSEEIQAVADATQAICDTFRELDEATAAQLRTVEF
ncbi:hypothetical protein ACFRCR_06575 [Oerskovia sp. NPDC056781]|uniref:WXG100 family type VII secretion target n=1 Tax=Oerskovia rustica TaxID=2762237 RepID=A0ABR8RWE0_9CELL|nr:hypothetical protein [Oerskovia rustica]MBD7952091.1 hypothetical protein [Oerskovia rustica]